MFVIRRKRVRVCVCACSGCAYLCVCVYTYVCSTCTHMCVHVYTYAFPRVHICVSRVHTCAFQLDTCVCVCSRRTCLLRMHMYVCSRVHTCAFQLDTCLCSRRTGEHMYVVRRTRVCVWGSAPRAHVGVFIWTHYVCSTCTHLCSRVHTCVHVYTLAGLNWTRVCVSGEYMIVIRRTVHVYTCVCVQRVHRRLFTCTHFCVPNRHVFVLKENTCLLSDEYSCVCLCFCVRINVRVFACAVHMCVFPCAHVCVFTCAHVCFPRVHMRVCSRVHTCVFAFQENTLLLSDEHTGVFRVHIYVSVHVRTYVCSRKRMIVFEVRTCVRVCVCALGAQLCLLTRAHMRVPRVHACVL